MLRDVVFAGFGGQGIMVSGQILAYTAMEEGYNVVWLPSYGPEMRGGTANCTVVVSDKPIASPIVANPETVVVMNNPSLERFAPTVRPGGMLIVNTSLVTVTCPRTDIVQVLIPATQIAIDLGSGKAANMVILGAYVGATKAVSLPGLTRFVEKKFATKPHIIELNLRALQEGYDRALKALENGRKNG